MGNALGTDLCPPAADDLSTSETDTALRLAPDGSGGVEWAAGGGGGTTFVGLTDTPSAFTSDENQLVGVNATPDALEHKTLTKVITASGALFLDPTLDAVVIGEAGVGNVGTASGTDVVVIGDNAGSAMTTMNQSVVIGADAAQNVTADFDAVFIGFNAGGVGTGTGAQYNTAVGFNALRGVAATALGQANTCLGAGAGESIAASSANTLVGAFAGEDVSTGSNNTVVGYNSAGGAVNLTTGSRNVVVGSFTDTPAVGSNDFIVIGDMSGSNLGSRIVVDPADDNVYMGSGTPGGYGTSTGNHNTAIGDAAATTLTTASQTTFVGAQAGAAGNHSDANTGIGYRALEGIGAVSMGQSNVAVGANAMRSNQGGNSNTAVGAGSAVGLSSGAQNVFIGESAGNQAVSVTSGSRNIVVGSTSLASATHNDVIVIKVDTGLGSNGQQIVVDPNVDGVFMGGASAGNWPTVSGVNNTSIGDASGIALTSGAGNTFIGADAGATETTGSTNTCIGVGADVPGAGTSNHVNLAGILFGDASGLDVRIGGSGAVSQAERLAVTDTNADTVEVFSLETTGTNGAKARFYVGTQAPGGTITAEPGSIYIRVAGTSSGVYNNTGASSGTTWTQL